MAFRFIMSAKSDSDKLAASQYFHGFNQAGRLPLTIEEGGGEIRKSTDAPGSLRPRRYSSLSLKDVVCLCCAGPRDDEAWEEFVSRVGKPISLTIMRTASLWDEPSRSLVEDLSQATYRKLWEDGCRHVRGFAIQHPEAVLGYLKITAANVAHDYFRHVNTQSFGGDKPHDSTSDVDPEAGKKGRGSQKTIGFRNLLKENAQNPKRFLTASRRVSGRTVFCVYVPHCMK